VREGGDENKRRREDLIRPRRRRCVYRVVRRFGTSHRAVRRTNGGSYGDGAPADLETERGGS
jgi:hypothetical protein